MDYGDILSIIEHIIEGIEFEELDLSEVKSKLQELAMNLEENLADFREEGESFDFEDLL